MNLRPAVILLALAVPFVMPPSEWLPTPLGSGAAQTQDALPLNTITPHLAAGQQYVNAANWDAAAREYDAVIAQQPPSVYSLRAYVMRGVVNLHRK